MRKSIPREKRARGGGPVIPAAGVTHLDIIGTVRIVGETMMFNVKMNQYPLYLRVIRRLLLG